jgi:hypothetical protein
MGSVDRCDVIFNSALPQRYYVLVFYVATPRIVGGSGLHEDGIVMIPRNSGNHPPSQLHSVVTYKNLV